MSISIQSHMMKYIGPNNLLMAFVYFFIINAVFIQMPLSGSLPGDLDTLANLAMFKDMGNHIVNLFQHAPLGSSNYPCKNTWALFGLDFFSGIIFLFFKLFQMSDLWAYHFFITTIYALNSFSLYKLCSLYSRSKSGCFLGGLFFSISNFLLANIDNPNDVLIFAGVLGLYFLIKAYREKSIRFFYLFVWLSALQFILAPVACVMLCFIIIPYFLFNFRTLFSLFINHRIQLLPISAVIIVLIPYVYYYLILKIPTVEYNIIRKIEVAPYLSMNLNDFFRTLPNNILFETEHTPQWSNLIKSGYVGIVMIAVVIVGLISLSKNKYPLLIFCTGFILCLGPYITLNGHVCFESPLLFLYRIIPLSDYIRIPSRFFIISLIGLNVFFSSGWEKIINIKTPFKWIPLLVFPIIYVIENLPIPIKKYSTYNMFLNNLNSLEYIAQSTNSNVLNLPSKLFVDKDYREYIYMLYQTIHKKNTINGCVAYVPYIRIVNDSLCRSAGQPSSLSALIRNNGIDLIIFYSDMADSSETKILNNLKSTKYLVPIDTLGNAKIFKVKK